MIENNNSAEQKQWLWIAAIVGVISLFAYFSVSVFRWFPWNIGRVLFYAFGPTLAIAAIAVGMLLRAERPRPLFDLGAVCTFAAGLVVNLMAVIQDSNFTVMGRRRAEAKLESTKDLLEQIMLGVNNVQISLDISFDIWISSATCLFALGALIYQKQRVFGALGVLIGAGALAVNFATLPTPPAEAGLFDPGPFVATWLGCFLALACWRARQSSRALRNGEEALT